MAIPSFLSRFSTLAKNFLTGGEPVNLQRKESLDKVSWIINKFNKYKEYYSDDRDRENENWKMFHGLDDGQWDSEAIAKLRDEGRHIAQYNFIRKKIDILSGYLLKNWFDVDFVPVEGEYSDLTNLLKVLYYSDKEMMDWDRSYMDFIYDFLIHGGTEQMVISDRIDPLGNIAFEHIMPGHTLLDPTWVTKTGWDLKELFKVGYLTAKEIKEKYKEVSDEVDYQIELIDRGSINTDSTDFDNADYPHLELNPLYGDKYQIVENHYIKKDKLKTEWVFDSNGYLIEVPSHLTDEEKRQWVIVNNIDIQSGVIEKDLWVDKYYVCSVCPQLFIDKPLEEKLDSIQIGRLPFFHSSALRVNGKDAGYVEIYKHIQETINKRESLIDHIIANSASGGALIDPVVFGNDYTKIENAKTNWNNPTYRELSAPGEIASGRKHIEELPRSQFPADVVNELQRMWGLSDSLGPVNSSFEGRSEGSEDRAGTIYVRKQQQVEIGLTTLTKELERHWNEKGEAYMLLAQSLYSGVYREFKIPGQKEGVTLNEEVPTANGLEIKNDLSKLPRHKVIISQSPQGISYREVQREINAELLRHLPAQNPISRSLVVTNIMKSLDSTSEERKEYEISAELEKQLALESTKAQIASFQAQQAQIGMQMQQIMSGVVPMDQGQESTQVQPQEGQQPIQPALPQK